jgi:transglutaminase-like putative cysteine protease
MAPLPGRLGPRSALFATVAATGWAMAHQELVAPALLVGPTVLGTTASWWRWGDRRRVRPEAVAVGVAALVLLAGGAAAPQRLPELLGGALAVGLVALSFDWTSAGRVRLSLLAALVVQVAATSDLPVASAALRLLAWAASAALALVLLHDHDRAQIPALGLHAPATGPRWRTGGSRVAVDAVAVVVLAALATAVVSQLHLDPPQGAAADPGDQPGQAVVAPYLGFVDQLDTGVRGEPGTQVVLRVQASAPDFWRGQTFADWDGRVWQRGEADGSGQPLIDYSGAGIDVAVWVPPSVGDEDRSTMSEPFVQRFEVVAPRSDLIFGAYRIEEIDVASSTVVVEQDGALRSLEPLGSGATYTVRSRRAEVTAERLAASDPLKSMLPPGVAEAYLDPGRVSDRVAALARDVTAGAPTTFDKVKALEAWMGANTTYTRDIPALPPGADAVDQHLFVDRRGYCEQIGTSLVVMLRSLGIPARLAVGYVPGEQALLGGEFTVRADDGHAWAEVYFPGVGWQGFDPTASVPLSGEHEGSFLASLRRLLERLGPVVVVLAAVAVVAAVVLAGRAGIRWLRRRRARSWVSVFFGRLERAGAARGRPRSAQETPGEYVAALAGVVMPDPRLLSVGDILTEAAWSGRAPAPESRVWAESVLVEATRRWPRPRPWRRRGRTRR